MDIISVIKATAYIYADCAKSASQNLIKSWPILIGSVAAYFILSFAAWLFFPLGFTGGFLLGAVELALLTYFYSWIRSAVSGDRVWFKELVQCDFALFFDILSVAFILFVVKYAIHMLIQGMNVDYILLLIQFVIVIVFNAIPEVIYIGKLESFEALKESARFTLENWIEWYIPLIVLLAPILLVVPTGVLAALAQTEELLPIMVIVTSWDFLGAYYGRILEFLGVFLGIWFMLFRGALFQELSQGTRRQRIYQSKQR